MPQTPPLPPAILLMGPTASGKTACALAVGPISRMAGGRAEVWGMMRVFGGRAL